MDLIPKQRLSIRQIQTPQRRVPIDQIIAVQGQNPLATGVETAGNVIGQTLLKRAQLRQQGEQIAQLANMAGETPPTGMTGLTPEVYEKGLGLKNTHEAKVSQAAKDRVELGLKVEVLRSEYSTTDPVTGITKTYPGVQGISIKDDENGNPVLDYSADYKPKIVPKTIGGGGGGGDDKDWGKLIKDINPQTASSRSTLGMASRANLNADRAIATLNKPVVTKAELGNVMADIAAIYQGGAPTDIGMSHQDWSTAYGGLKGSMQYLTGNPQDAVPDNIKARILEDLKGMKSINQSSIKRNLDFIEKGRAGLINRHSSEWKNARRELEGDSSDSGVLSPAAQALIQRHR